MEVVTLALWNTSGWGKGRFGFDRLVTVYVDGKFGDTSLGIFVKAFLD